MGKFKVGDKVVLRKDSEWYGSRNQIPKGSYATVIDNKGSYEGYKYSVDWSGGYNQYRDEDLELYQEEKKQMLKQDWSIKVENKEQAEAYKQTLLAFGYVLTKYKFRQEYTDSVVQITHGSLVSNQCFWMSEGTVSVEHKFDNISDFLIWHFAPEETEEQKQIHELEETILKAQQQIQQLKEKI